MDSMTRISFRPPLRRRYNLSRTVMLGNVAEISHGQSVLEQGVQLGLQAPSVSLARGPLTWLRDANAREGRRPPVELRVAGRTWTRSEDLRGSDATGAVFTVEVDAEGRASVRIGDGEQGAALPSGAEIELGYRVGIGRGGNRDGGAISDLAKAHVAIGSTFNPLPTVGGSDPESTEQARRRARSGIHALDRAISVADVRSLAETYDGVLCALAMRDPVRRREHLRVVVCAEEAAILSESEREQLRRFLSARLPPGASVSVVNYQAVPIRARIRIWVNPGSDPLEVIAEIRLRLGLDRGDEREPGLLDPRRAALGRDIELSDLYRPLQGLEAVARLQIEALYRAGTQVLRNERIAIAETEVALWAAADTDGEALALFWEEASER
jgi:predicted phage baseplate assembly protein